MIVAELTRHTCGPDFKAKHDGKCKLCPEPIVAGVDFVTKVDDVGIFHSHCGRAYCRTLDEHLPEEAADDAAA